MSDGKTSEDMALIEKALSEVYEESQIEHYKKTAVAHYTRMETLLHILKSAKQLAEGGKLRSAGWASARATPVQFLNDRQELLHGLKALSKCANSLLSKDTSNARLGFLCSILDSFTKDDGSLKTDVFQMSFSGEDDELGQWRGYAANGMGCSVITSVESIKSIEGLICGWVIYEEAEQMKFANKVIEKALHSSRLYNLTALSFALQRVIAVTASFMKHDGFKREQEFRVVTLPETSRVKFRESNDRLLPYIDFLEVADATLALAKIKIGPGWQLANLGEEFLRHHVVQGVSRLMESCGINNVNIEPSSIPYDPK